MYMPATVWKGHLSFGLVSIPVRLFRAARAQRVNLRQLCRPKQALPVETIVAGNVPNAALVGERTPTATSRKESDAALDERAPVSNPADEVVPVKRIYEPSDGRDNDQPIRPDDLVKGYEYAKGEYVVLDDEELRTISPKTSTELQIVEFVHFNEIDPVYLETSYYIAPDESGEKPYALLFKAMEESGYAAIGQLTMHRRDHVVILRTGRSGLIAHTMFYSDEVRTVDEFRTNTSLVSSKELDLAKTLINALATSFQPDKFKNDFRERLQQLIESRAAHRQVTQVAVPTAPKVIDIMDALKRSLEQARLVEPPQERKPVKVERKPASTEQSAKKIRPQPSQKKR
jgi:DNA end-binding protein Ku